MMRTVNSKSLSKFNLWHSRLNKYYIMGSFKTFLFQSITQIIYIKRIAIIAMHHDEKKKGFPAAKVALAPRETLDLDRAQDMFRHK